MELFMTGQETPFESELDERDEVMKKLVEGNRVDEIVLPLLQNIFIAVKQMFQRMIPEHLPGGKFWNPSYELLQQTSSGKKHNKLPEFVFGQLDHLIAYRPNASLLANEAYIIYSFNKTSKWLEELPEDERNQYIEESRKQGRQIRKKFKERIKIIQEKLLEQQIQKQEELARREAERLKKAENNTSDVCYYGLWQSPAQVDEGIASLEGNEKEIEAALKSQLLFRKNVLKQQYKDKKVYNFSMLDARGKYKKFDNHTLKENVLCLVRSASDVDTAEVKKGNIPLFVGKNIEHKFADGQVYLGHVISIVPGFAEWYNVQYENDPAVYAYNLRQDYNNGDVKLVVKDT